MTINANDLFDMVKNSIPEDIRGKVEKLLLSEQMKVDQDSPTNGLINEILPTLKARYLISLKNGTMIYGLADLINTFDKFSGDVKVLGYGVSGPVGAGIIYCLEENSRGIGVMLVDLSQDSHC